MQTASVRYFPFLLKRKMPQDMFFSIARLLCSICELKYIYHAHPLFSELYTICIFLFALLLYEHFITFLIVIPRSRFINLYPNVFVE